MATTLPTFQLTPVNSSRLAAIGYDGDSFALYVQFPPSKKAPRGKVFRYDNISEEVFDDLKNAPSIGQFFGLNIVNNPDKYPFVCVDEGTGEPTAEATAAPKAQIAPEPSGHAAPSHPEGCNCMPCGLLRQSKRGPIAEVLSPRSRTTKQA